MPGEFTATEGECCEKSVRSGSYLWQIMRRKFTSTASESLGSCYRCLGNSLPKPWRQRVPEVPVPFSGKSRITVGEFRKNYEQWLATSLSQCPNRLQKREYLQILMVSPAIQFVPQPHKIPKSTGSDRPRSIKWIPQYRNYCSEFVCCNSLSHPLFDESWDPELLHAWQTRCSSKEVLWIHIAMCNKFAASAGEIAAPAVKSWGSICLYLINSLPQPANLVSPRLNRYHVKRISSDVAATGESTTRSRIS